MERDRRPHSPTRWRAIILIAGLGAILASCGVENGSQDSLESDRKPAIGNYAVLSRIAGPDGGFDYLSVDSVSRTLFIAREYGVMSMNLVTKAVVGRVMAAADVSAVVPIPGGPLMLVTVYGNNQAILFDRTTGRRVAEIPTGTNPDAAIYDNSSGLAYVMNAGSEDITVIDVRMRRVGGTIPVAGKPEMAVSDGAGKIYVNLKDTARIAIIDASKRRVTEHFVLPGCVEPTGLAHDRQSDLLIAACHNRVVKLIDRATGADRGTVAVGADADGVIFDPVQRIVFIPCDDGTLTIFRLGRDGAVEVVTKMETAPGARTAAIDPATHRLYLAARGDAKGGIPSKRFQIIEVGEVK